MSTVLSSIWSQIEFPGLEQCGLGTSSAYVDLSLGFHGAHLSGNGDLDLDTGLDVDNDLLDDLGGGVQIDETLVDSLKDGEI